jgi:tetratricopeptide (TPR) repeat protein
LVLLAFLVPATLAAQTRDGVDVLLGKARSLEVRGRMDLAAQNWSQVLLVDPNQREALAGLARHAKQSGDANNERLYLGRLRKLNPTDPAIAAIERMRVLTRQEQARLDEAGRLAAQKRPDEAMKIYLQLFGDEPPWGKWAETYYDTLALSTGGRPKAIARLRTLSSRDPDNEVYRLWLARILSYDEKTRMEALRLFGSIHDSGTVEQARSVWRQALAWEKENPAVQQSLEAYLKRYPDQELQQAANRLREKSELATQDAAKERGFQALRSNDLVTAEVTFDDVLRRSPKDVNAMAGLGFVRLDQKRFDEALSLFDKARTLDPQRADVREGHETAQYWSYMQRGAAMQQRDAEAAMAAYQAALAMRPNEEEPVLAIGQVMLRQGDLAGAGLRFDQVLKRSPSNADAIVGLGFVRLKEKNFAEAANLLGKARTLTPDRPDVEEGYRTARFWGLVTNASKALDENRPDAAIAGFEQALQIDETSTDALMGLAGATERTRNYAAAARAYMRLTTALPNDEKVWLGLVRVQVGAGEHNAALQSYQRAPMEVRRKLEARADHLSRLALALFAGDQQVAADSMLRRALAAAARDDTDEALGIRLQIANLLKKQGRVEQAMAIYKQTTDIHPANIIAWQGLVGAYAERRDFARAISAVRAMPRNAYDAATKDAGFLNAVAAAYSADGQCSQAEDLLNRSIALERAAGRRAAESTYLHLADVAMRQGRYDKAGQIYRDVVNGNAESVEAWRGFFTALHTQGDDRTLLNEARRIPAATRARLGSDEGMLTILAAAHSKAGEHLEVVKLLEAARGLYRSKGQVPPADLDLQLGWALLSASGSDTLADLLPKTRARTDLTESQREQVDELWTTWALRRAEEAVKVGDDDRAAGILTEAGGRMPGNSRMQAALAALYARKEDWAMALHVYESWGMAGASAADYRAAAGAALGARDTARADRFLHEGLARWPNDRDLLHMTGRRAVSQGNYREAEGLLKSALTAAVDTRARAPQTTVRTEPLTPPHAASTPACRQDTASHAPQGFRITPATFVGRTAPALLRMQNGPAARGSGLRAQGSGTGNQGSGNQAPQNGGAEPQSGSADPPASSAEPQDPQPVGQIEDELDVVRHRNTPFAAAAVDFRGRAGDPGLARLVVLDFGPGGSTALRDQVRIGIDIHTLALNNGAPDGQSDYRFGSLPLGGLFPEQHARGYGGEIQMSMDVFGAMFGTSPRGFLNETWTGGVRLGSPDAPVRLIAARDLVKDSMLSYAGARDPGTGTRWGGVVSNSVFLHFNRDESGNGQYVSVGGGTLRGVNVDDNWNAAAGAGAYWTIGTGDQANLTLGADVTAMHYAKNLSFFTLGHGGYFSPQLYFMASMPVRWNIKRAGGTYEIRISPGIQHFVEASSPLYPTGAILTPPEPFAPLVYPEQTRTAPNYDVGFRADYRLTPHLHLVAFANANNTRDFNQQVFGIALKVLALRLPASRELSVRAIPDWRGNQPLGN